MPGYLLDTNHVGLVCRRDPNVLAKLNSLPPETQVRTCVITLGEVEAGHLITKTTNQTKRDEWTAVLNAEFLPEVIPITGSTRHTYAFIVSEILKKHPSKPRTRTETHLVSVGVDINDVWIAAVALERGFTLVTEDKMKCIRAAAPSLKFESWL